jgi:hypothetical protein
MTVVPAKKTLLPGESTDITIELKDCDNQPLVGRTINFNGSKGEVTIPGTIGGIVTPSKIVTDASGKATAKFKMTAARGAPAIINAYSLSQTVSACTDAFFGTAKLDALQAYKIEIDYTKSGRDASKMESAEDGVVFKGGSGRFWEVNYFLTAYYTPPVGHPADQQMVIMPDEQNIAIEPLEDEKVEVEPLVKTDDVEIESLVPAVNIETPVNIHYLKGTKLGKSHFYFTGRSELHGWSKGLSLAASPIGMTTDGGKEFEAIVSDDPLPPSISMMFKNNQLVFFSCGFDFFPDKNDKSAPGGEFGIELNNKKYFPLKGIKITDPKTVYKTVYILEYRNIDTSASDAKMMKQEKNEMEVATVKIYSTF